MRDESPACGRMALERWAPGPAAALDALETAVWRAMTEAGRVDLFDLTARMVAGLHGLAPLERPETSGPSPWSAVDATRWRELEALDPDERKALAFAEQMSFDVASLGVKEREALYEARGTRAPSFAQASYGADLLPRARAALDALFGESEPQRGSAAAGSAAGEVPAAADLASAIDALIRVVPSLQALDPVTTELVRLLGARRHRCRICQSLRSRSALAAGADDALFAAVDQHATSDLEPAQRAALAFAEAFLGTPGRVDRDCARALRTHFSPAACVELVLDVTRNATNKVAVALAADAPRVETGYEIYDVTPEGELLYGLDAP